MGTDIWIIDGGLGECLSVVHLGIVGIISFLVGYFSQYIFKRKNKSNNTQEKEEKKKKKQEDTESEEEEEEEDVDRVKMVLVVRTDLEMGKGKAAAQCCHACLAAYESSLARRKHKVSIPQHPARYNTLTMSN